MRTAGRLVSWILAGLVLAVGTTTTTTISWATTDPYYKEHVYKECRHTRYPHLCTETLFVLGSGGIQLVDILSALVNKTISEHQFPVLNFAKLSYHFISLEAQHARIITGNCRELMDMSLKRLNQAFSAVKESPRKNKQNIQTWLSAALTFQEACKDSAEERDGLANEFMAQISQKMDYLSQLTSNTLALVNRITGKASPKGRRLLAEEQIFPGWVSAKGRKLLQSNTNTIKANAVVAKDGSGNYQTVSEAIKAASGRRFVIYVKSGVYKEKIRTNKDGITLIGDGKYSTIIVGDDSVKGGSNMPGTATFAITGDEFIAKDIGFQNTAGPAAGQALALLVASDRSVIYRCSIAGNQDTLYALSLRQFYRECDIYGTVDFIFGNAAAVFQNCYLVVRRPRSGGEYNVILANGRSDPGQNTGFSVQNCKISFASDFSSAKHSFSSYLGRPWKQYSRSVVMQSTINDQIAPRGWVEWPGASSSSLKTLYFAEYANLGPGAATSNRVKWPGFHLIAKDEAIKFTVGNFISGTSWIPSTGVDFVSGL